MLKALFCAMLLTPMLAHAEDKCRFQAPRSAAIDLTGVHALVIQTGRHDLHLVGSAANAARIGGRACASSADMLGALQVTQRRDGDRLIVAAANDPRGSNAFNFSNRSWRCDESNVF